jgi:hypothetical protein
VLSKTKGKSAAAPGPIRRITHSQKTLGNINHPFFRDCNAKALMFSSRSEVRPAKSGALLLKT